MVLTTCPTSAILSKATNNPRRKYIINIIIIISIISLKLVCVQNGGWELAALRKLMDSIASDALHKLKVLVDCARLLELLSYSTHSCRSRPACAQVLMANNTGTDGGALFIKKSQVTFAEVSLMGPSWFIEQGPQPRGTI